MMGARPPRIARIVLLALTPSEWRDQIDGDLTENYAWRRAQRGAWAARWWYYRQLGTLDVWRLRARSARRHPAPGARGAGFGSDVRFGLRALRREPLYAGMVIGTLALGIGTTGAMFAVVNSVLLRPLPYHESDRLALVFRTVPRLGFTHSTVSYPDYLDWRAAARSFADLAAFGFTSRTYVDGDGADRWRGYRVTANLFALLGTPAVLGRTFGPDDDEPGAPPAVILSHAEWASRFGADSSVVGRGILLDGEQHTVIGVMPPDFDFPSRTTVFWVPLREDPSRSERDTNFLIVLGRLRPRVTLDDAQRELAALAARIDAEAPGANEGFGIQVEGRHAYLVRNARTALWTFLGAVVLVLLIGIANVANLTLARGTTRRREFSVRTALGASRSRLVRQLLTESALLGALGGAAGLALAFGLMRVFVWLGPADLPRLHEIDLDGVVVLITAVVSVGSGIVFGCVPAVLGSGQPAGDALREAGAAPGLGRWGRRMQRGFVVGEIALAMALTVGAGLFINSLARLTSVDPGFDPENVVAGRVAPPRPEFRPGMTEADMIAAMGSQQQFYADLLAGLRAIPGVRAAGLAYALPLTPGGFSRVVEPEGAAFTDGEGPTVDGNVVFGDYFRAMQIPLVAGRGFTDADGLDGPLVMVVSESMADAFWPGRDAVGQRVMLGDGSNRPWVTVVGVVADVRRESLAESRTPMYYRPLTQARWPDAMFAVVRSTVPAAEVVPAVRERVHRLRAEVPLTDVTSAEQLLTSAVAGPRYRTLVLGAFGVLAVVLAVVGIYGVMAFSVVDRRREIGIRLALGAERAGVLRMVVGQGLGFAALGVGLGTIASVALADVLTGMLFGLSPLDPLTYVLAATLMLTVAVVACVGPARRAARIEPMESMRCE